MSTLSPNTIDAPWKLAGMPPDTPVLLALSGGMDSVTLLHLLSIRAQTDGFRLTVAHVNHGIRGAEAERDAEFCRSLAKQYGWEFLLLNADVPALAKERGTGIEETARSVRYEFFERIMRERNIPLLAVAHQADDNLETVLFHICRGTGLKGLCGIPPIRAFAGGVLTRPLLEFTRENIAGYCRQEGLKFVQDSTNSDETYSRNRIRHRVIPEMEQVFPGLRERICRMTYSLLSDEEYLEDATINFLSQHLRRNDMSLPIEPLMKSHSAIRRRILMLLSRNSLHTVHLKALENLLNRGISGTSCVLPGGCCACVQQGRVSFLPDLRGASLPESLPFREGITPLCDGKLTIRVTKIENCSDTTKIHNLSIDPYIILKGFSDIMLQQLFWRNRCEGDHILLRGRMRRLRRLYREAGIPPMLREALPVLCDGEGILWAPYVGLRDGVEARGENACGGYQIEISLSVSEKG